VTQRRRHLLVALVAIAASIPLFMQAQTWLAQARTWLAIDGCLDRGGRWDYDGNRCVTRD